VTANTRRDGEDFLALAAEIPIRPTTTEYPFEKTDIALEDLARDAVNGAAVVRVAAGR
jgi:propanol-preferring alcohol dehydrogenase